MNHFAYRRGALHAEGVPLERIAAEVGTPTYVYSTATLTRHFRVLTDAFSAMDALLCYSVKASSNLALLALLAKQGSGFDIVSGGELRRVQKARAKPSRVVFSGVGKTADEMAYALDAGILMFNVESEEELLTLDRVGRERGVRAPFALRVNPDVDAKTHRHISTGLKSSKFGVPFEEAVRLYKKARKLRGVVPRGVDCHIGSQLTQIAPVKAALDKVAGLYQTLRAQGLPLEYLDIGGGLGITYRDETPPSPAAYAEVVRKAVAPLGAKLIVEPGRVLVGNAAVLLTRVVYRKPTASRTFLVVDAGMNDLIRPALYDAHHEISPVKPRRGKALPVDVVGPICESTDRFAEARVLPPLRPGDLCVFRTAGAYGMTMASTYNSRRRAAEVLVDGDAFRVVREREAYPDLWRGEHL